LFGNRSFSPPLGNYSLELDAYIITASHSIETDFWQKGELPLEEIESVVEINGNFLIIGQSQLSEMQKPKWIIIPNRAFSSEDEKGHFREFLIQSIRANTARVRLLSL